jgi:hypothetical protein
VKRLIKKIKNEEGRNFAQVDYIRHKY